MKHQVVELTRRKQYRWKLTCSCGKTVRARDPFLAQLEHDLHVMDCHNKEIGGFP